MLIEDPDKAAKLARAIFSDLTLYNGDKLARASDPRTDLAPEIAEGRSLFQSRVSPAHHAIFETALAQWSPPRGTPTAEPAAAPAPREEEKPSPRREDPDEARFARTMVAIVVALIAAGFVSTLLYQHHQHEKLEQESHDKH